MLSEEISITPEDQPEKDQIIAGRPGFDYRMTHVEIRELPLQRYDGPVHVIRTMEAVPDAVAALKKETILGFDTETRPSFTKGTVYKPALLQLAGEDAVYLFQLKLIGLPNPLIDLLSDPGIIKTGVGIGRDVVELRELSPFTPAGFQDVSDASKEAGILNHGLKGLAGVLLGIRISKRAQLSNWAHHKYSAAQINYAATDAWISRELYIRLQQINKPSD